MSSGDGGALHGQRAPALEMRRISKKFGSIVANAGIDLTVTPGEIVALLGENGAGKSTLMNILYGLIAPDAGEILIDGEPVTIRDPADAISRGIGMVHQHFMLVPVLSVAENVVLGDEIMRGPLFLDLPAAERRIRELAAELGFAIDPRARIDTLSVGQQQRVEILKALFRGARLLVLDEPTAVLTPQEAREIFGVLRRLRDEGTSIVFISHKLDEVLEIADRVVVIRRGAVVGERSPAETSEAELAELMVGRSVSLRVERGESSPGETVLVVKGLQAKDDRGHVAVQGAELDVRAGEIHGIAGVAGNGQEELVEAIVGLRHATGGSVGLAGRDVTRSSPRALHEAGVAYVPGDRQRYGLVLSFPIEDDLCLTTYHAKPYATGPGRALRDDGAVRDRAVALIEEFDIRTSSPSLAARTLSGGNQQKVVIARELRPGLRLLVLEQPTRGLDVGSIEFIHRRVVEARDSGVAVLLVSAELDEILDLSDRVSVMYRGRLVATLPSAEASRERIGLLMAKGTE